MIPNTSWLMENMNAKAPTQPVKPQHNCWSEWQHMMLVCLSAKTGRTQTYLFKSFQFTPSTFTVTQLAFMGFYKQRSPDCRDYLYSLQCQHLLSLTSIEFVFPLCGFTSCVVPFAFVICCVGCLRQLKDCPYPWHTDCAWLAFVWPSF